MDARLARFLVASAALTAAHQVADHWVQTDHQAMAKGAPGRAGRLACARHVASYTAVQAVALVGAARWLNVPLTGRWTAAALATSAVSHYVADRREPLRRMAEATGHAPFYRLNTGGLNGAYLMDQSWHYGWIFVAALVAAGNRD
jgi:hypothetical protein